MRRTILAFLIGLTLGMWADAALIIYSGDIPAWEWVFDPVDEEVDPLEDVPDEDWYDKATPRFRPA